MVPMTLRDRFTTSGDMFSGFALKRMAKLVRCVHSHTVCVELDKLSLLTHPSVSHLPWNNGLPLCACMCVCVCKWEPQLYSANSA